FDINLATSDNFTATIDWGNGHTSAGTVGPLFTTLLGNVGLPSIGGLLIHPGVFFGVTGTNTYDQAGTYTITVTIHNVAGNFDVTATGMATVESNAHPHLFAFGQDIDGQSGPAFTGRVAGFVDHDQNPQASQFTATIDWGDGTTSDGTVSAGVHPGEAHILGGPGDLVHIWGNVFQVQGAHTYAKEGSYTVTVTINDKLDNGAATATSTAVITPPIQAQLGAIGRDITPIAGTAFTGAVAGFLDNNPNVTADNFTAS